MSVQASVVTLPGLVADTDLSAKQFYAVKLTSTAGRVKLAAGTSDLVVGILQNKPTAGMEAEIAVGGLVKAIAATSVGWTEGVRAGADSAGKLAPATGDNAPFIGVYHKLSGQGTVAINQIVSLMLVPAALRN